MPAATRAGHQSTRSARSTATGPLNIPFASNNTALASDPRAPQPPECIRAAFADFPGRWALPQWTGDSSSSSDYFGPRPRTYPTVVGSQVPAQCNPTAWAWSRLLAAINETVALGLNYCHHHAPAYTASARQRARCDGTLESEYKCVCSAAGLSKPQPWSGGSKCLAPVRVSCVCLCVCTCVLCTNKKHQTAVVLPHAAPIQGTVLFSAPVQV